MIDLIKKCFIENRILWTYHVNMRLRERSIRRIQLVDALDTFEIIESYIDDKPYPSYLVYCRYKKSIFHILAAVDENSEMVTIVTTYQPDPMKWDSEMKRRL